MVHFATAGAPQTTYADVTLGNSVRLHYAHQGPTTGPAIILLHGYSDSSFSFSRIMPLLPERRVIAPDLRGHGDSDKPAAGYRVVDLADDIIQMIDLLDVPSVIIVGHSMGSFIAQAVVERASHRVSGLVLVASAPVVANDVVMELRSTVNALTDPVDPAFVRGFQYGTIAQPVPDDFMDAAIAISRRVPASIWKLLLEGMIDFKPQLPRSSVRTLVLGGRRDRVFSVNEQVALAQQYPFAKFRLLEQVGHAPHWEQPEAFVRALLPFVR